MDLALQCSHQSHCRKLVLYQEDPDCKLFPPDFCQRVRPAVGFQKALV